jgi:hypothetical protein
MVFKKLTILSLQGQCCTAHTSTHNHNFSNIIITIVLHIFDRNRDFPTEQAPKNHVSNFVSMVICHFSSRNSHNESQYWITAVNALKLQPNNGKMNQPLSQTFTATWHLFLSPMHATSHLCDITSVSPWVCYTWSWVSIHMYMSYHPVISYDLAHRTFTVPSSWHHTMNKNKAFSSIFTTDTRSWSIPDWGVIL